MRYRVDYNDRADGYVLVDTMTGRMVPRHRYGTQGYAAQVALRLDHWQRRQKLHDRIDALEAVLRRLRVVLPDLLPLGFPCVIEGGICVQHSRSLPCVFGEVRQLLGLEAS